MNQDNVPSPFHSFAREDWQELRRSWPMVLTEAELESIRGLGDEIDLDEVAQIYLPLSRLIYFQVRAKNKLYRTSHEFFGDTYTPQESPFIVAIAGSVAVGKSTTARVLQILLSRWEPRPRVDLVTTDGFLYPSAYLEENNLMARKGFPESYDRRALLEFVSDVKNGDAARAPLYDHGTYDIIPGKFQEIDRPDILILEGLNVLQTGHTLMVSDFIDFSIYVDADTQDIESWFLKRIFMLRDTAFQDPDSYYHRFIHMSDDELHEMAHGIWKSINELNLVENILPTKPRANLILKKNIDHTVEQVLLRKI
ncbi:MAG TPA: type I pantothenate kinase [Corynebacteriales bacterium]|nr:type I pantothenate kinase [Mycobacteriales bacterium]